LHFFRFIDSEKNPADRRGRRNTKMWDYVRERQRCASGHLDGIYLIMPLAHAPITAPCGL
jgi:hypothetical protein